MIKTTVFSMSNYVWLVSHFKTSIIKRHYGHPLVYLRSNDKTYVDTLRSEANKQGTKDGTHGRESIIRSHGPRYNEIQWAQMPTPQELAGHIKKAVDWNNTHTGSSYPNAVLINAWNENNEGGRLARTDNRIQAVLMRSCKIL